MISRKFLDIMSYWVDIRKESALCSVGVDYPESFRIIEMSELEKAKSFALDFQENALPSPN